MIDYLSLTIHLPPDKNFVEYHGKITEDLCKSRMYRYMCELENVRLLYYPHKFKKSTNAIMPFTNIILNPKYFKSFDEIEIYIFAIFNNTNFNLEDINVTRIDIAADVPDVNVQAIISTMHIKGIRKFRLYDDTIYAGSNPLVRVYDKLKEIRSRLKKAQRVIDAEKGLLKEYKELTRFEIEIKSPKLNLKQLMDNPIGLVSYFDRLNFIKMSCENPCGVMQVMFKQVNRKFRKQLEALQDMNLLQKIKETYTLDVVKWFAQEEPF
jgi:hypothetical protein